MLRLVWLVLSCALGVALAPRAADAQDLAILDPGSLARDGVGARGPALRIPPPPASVQLRPATVRFRGNLERLSVLYLADPALEEDASGALVVRLASPSRYAPLCEVPCDRELPQTHLGLAVSRGGRLIRLAEPFGVDGPTSVEIDWDDRSVERLAGTLTLAIGIPLGVLLGTLPMMVELSDRGHLGDAGVASLIAGSVLAVASIVVGVVLLLMEDGATFSATPLPADAGALFTSDWR